MAAAGLEQVLAWGVPGIAAALGERTRALDHALDANGLSTWKTPGHAPLLTALRPPAQRLDAVFDPLARERSRSEEHTSKLQPRMRTPYAGLRCKKTQDT